MSLEIGQILDGKYRITRLLGEGAMGAVFEGENARIKRRVAIKVLHSSVAARRDLVDRFEREAQAAGRIGSEHIVEVLDLGELPDGSRYLVMEFLDGQSLGQRIEQVGRMLPVPLLTIIRQLLVGLGAAHAAGIVHRDLKPDNIFLLKEKAGHRDFVKIVDFGVSKFSPLAGEEAKMTQTGAVMGTPYYMSPEQAKGARDIDHRSDLFSVGVILYEGITGRVPFDGETFNELMFKIALQDPPPPESIVPGLDPGVGALIRKALARDPAQRFSDAAAFISAIDDFLRTGRSSISVPPPQQVALQPLSVAGPGGTMQLPDGHPALAAAQAAAAAKNPTQAATRSTWSQSGGGAPPAPPKNNTGLVVGLAIAGVLLLGGSGVAAVKLMGGGGEKVAAAPPEKDASDAKKAEPKPEDKPEDPKPAESAPSVPASASAAAPAPDAPAPSASVAAAPAPEPRRTTTTVKKPTPTATTAPTATAAKPAPTSTGRKVRDDI